MEALLAITFLLCLAVQPALAQVARGTLRGRITDATGSVVPGVEVSATHKSTGLASSHCKQWRKAPASPARDSSRARISPWHDSSKSHT